MSASTRDLPSLENGAERLSKRAWGMLLVLCGAIFLDALDVSMIGVALPSIRTDLDMSTSSLQWVVSGYVLGYGGFLLLGGRAGIPGSNQADWLRFMQRHMKDVLNGYSIHVYWTNGNYARFEQTIEGAALHLPSLPQPVRSRPAMLADLW